MKQIKNLLKTCSMMAATACVLLAACEKKPAGQATPPPQKIPATPSDPMEAKKKRMGEIVREIMDLSSKAQKDPKLAGDPATQNKMEALEKEGDAILKELSGGDRSKEDKLMKEITLKYAPEFYATMQAREEKADIASTRARQQTIRDALEQHHLDHARYPEALSDLIHPKEGKHAYMAGGDDYLKDLWGHPFVYTLSGPNRYRLISKGPDGKEGTPDDIELK